MKQAVNATAVTPATSVFFYEQHPEIVWLLLGFALLTVGWFLARFIKAIEETNEKQWRAISQLRADFSDLHGEHRAYHGPDRRQTPTK